MMFFCLADIQCPVMSRMQSATRIRKMLFSYANITDDDGREESRLQSDKTRKRDSTLEDLNHSTTNLRVMSCRCPAISVDDDGDLSFPRPLVWQKACLVFHVGILHRSYRTSGKAALWFHSSSFVNLQHYPPKLQYIVCNQCIPNLLTFHRLNRRQPLSRMTITSHHSPSHVTASRNVNPQFVFFQRLKSHRLESCLNISLAK